MFWVFIMLAVFIACCVSAGRTAANRKRVEREIASDPDKRLWEPGKYIDCDRSAKITATATGVIIVNGNGAETRLPYNAINMMEVSPDDGKYGKITLQTTRSGGFVNTGSGVSVSGGSTVMVTYFSVQKEAVQAFRDYVWKRLGSSGSSSQVSEDVSDQLRKLLELKNDGVLTEAEFAHKKKQLLGL